MACTTILVGKKASYDGSTMIARNDDSGSGHFTAKKFTVVHPEDLPKVYRSVLSHVEVPLPEGAMRFTAMPNAVEGKGIWAASGVNAANVGMTATETITSNPRVLGADPLVEYRPAKGGQSEVLGGIAAGLCRSGKRTSGASTHGRRFPPAPCPSSSVRTARRRLSFHPGSCIGSDRLVVKAEGWIVDLSLRSSLHRQPRATLRQSAFHSARCCSRDASLDASGAPAFCATAQGASPFGSSRTFFRPSSRRAQ